MRKGSKRLLGAGIVAGIAYAGWRAWKTRVPETSNVSWDSAPFPFPPVPRPSTAAVTEAPGSNGAGAFVDPGDDGACPLTHPVKAKLASGIYHVPGGGNYERTKPDRCNKSAKAAEADALRTAKH